MSSFKENNRRSAYVYPVLGVLLIAVGVMMGFTLRDPSPLLLQNRVSKLEEVIRYINEYYFEPVDNAKLVDDAISGMLQKLDPHTFYIPSAELKSINEQMAGSFEGIGVEFNIIEDTLYVVTPISGGPSEKLGVMAGDRIVKIDDENVAGIGLTNNDVIKRLKGKKGTHVKINVKRNGIKELLDFDIVRDKIPLYSVDFSYMVDKKTGYIRVNRFAETTMREFDEHLKKLKAEGLENLILDLRNNPGGYLEMAYMMADEFLSDKKLIVYTEGRTQSSKKRYESTGTISDFETGGLVVLINQGSASASEIVSGAVQDWDRGLVVGTRSFGKGLVQQQYPLSDESAVRIVVSRYFTPSGRCIQKPFDKGAKDYDSEVYERFESGEVYDESKIKLPDSLKFKTQAGRTVYGGGGIIPDVFVPVDTTGDSPYWRKVVSKGLIRDFAYKYAESHPNLKTEYPTGFAYSEKFSVSQNLINEFTLFAGEKGVPFVEKDFKASQKVITTNIKALIGRALYNDDGYFPVLLNVDNAFQKAFSLMQDAKKLERTGKFKN